MTTERERPPPLVQKKERIKEECQTSIRSAGENSFPQPRSAPQAEWMRGPLNVASSSPFQYLFLSKSNTCDIKIKLLSLDLCSNFPDKINRAGQHLNTDKENWLRVHFKPTGKARPDTQSHCARNFDHKIIANVLKRELIAKIWFHRR